MKLFWRFIRTDIKKSKRNFALFGLPAGAAGTLTVQRTLAHGPRMGILTGLGASVADCFYAVVGAFGWTWISVF